MRNSKEQGYKGMHPFILNLESQDYGALSYPSAGNKLGVGRKLKGTSNLVKHGEVLAESKWCKEVHYQSTMDPESPELVAFLQETSASGERSPPHGKCGVRGCELDQNAVSCILDLDVDSGSQVTSQALWTETSTLYVVKFRANQVIHKARLEIRSPEQIAMDKRLDVHVEGKIPGEHILPEMTPLAGHIPGETSGTSISAASHTAAAIEHDVPPNINQRQECPGSSEFANAFEVEGKLKLGSMMSETRTKSGEIDKQKQVCGDAYFSAESPLTTPARESNSAPYVRTISLRSNSNSSATSSNSFSFPLLPFEWNSSPMKMAKANRTKLQEQRSRPWWTHFVCCKQKYKRRCESDDEIAHQIVKS